MLTEEALRAALTRHADEAGVPPATFATRVTSGVRRRRRQRRSLSALATAVVVAAGVLIAVPGHHGAASKLELATTPTIEPTVTENPATDGLTGSLCDEPGSAKPVNYLDWPCVTASARARPEILGLAYAELNGVYTGLTAPRLRLIADDTASLKGHYGAAEFWDADHLDTPAVVLEFNEGGGGNVVVDARDPSMLFAGNFVIARAPIARIRLEPQNKLIPVDHGIATLTGLDAQVATKAVGLDSSGQTRSGWSTPVGSTQAFFAAQEKPLDQLCAGKQGTGTCGGHQTVAAQASVSDLCQSPAGTPPPSYLDWPCAKPADAATGHRVLVAEQDLLSGLRGVKKPMVRLLADTRSFAGKEYGNAVTVIELWDGDDTGPAVITAVSSQNGGQLEDFGTSAAEPAGTAMVVFNSGPGTEDAQAPVLVRSGIAKIRFAHNGISETVPVTDGLALLTGFPRLEKTSTQRWTLTALDANGLTVTTEPFERPYAAPCPAGTYTSTCVGADGPSFGPTPTATP